MKTQKSEEAIVAEIHESFNTYGDKLLLEAKALLGKTIDSTKADRLKKLGFTNTTEVSKVDKFNKNKTEKTRLAEVIRQYSEKYPLYRFITEEGVQKICKKYGLIMGEVTKYKGTVPDKNLVEIENFRIKDEDCVENPVFHFPMLSTIFYSMSFGMREHKPLEEDVQVKKYDKTFRICAPQKDFDTKGMKLEGHKLVVKDPVVLHRVKDGYLIVTAWGLEASDESVTNSKFN